MYNMIDCTILNLVALGPGSFMLKLNLESAFWHIPVCQADWLLLRFEYGARLASYIFNPLYRGTALDSSVQFPHTHLSLPQ